VGCGAATGVLNRGWEVAEAADDGGQELRRSSGEAWCSKRRKRSKMGVRECKSETVGSLGTCFKSRRRHGERELLLASRWARGARGDGGATWSSEERASAGRVSSRRDAGGARGAEKSGAGQLWLRKAASEGGGRAQRETERGRAGGRRLGPFCNFSKSAGTPL
jgi:hypothetical protein